MTTPYVDPNTVHTPSTGTSPPAAWGTTVRNDLQTLATPPGCVVSRAVNQTIANSTLTAVAFTATDLRDTDNYHDTTTNNTRCTVPTGLAGWYLIVGRLTYAANATGYRLLTFTVNGTAEHRVSLLTVVGAGNITDMSGSEMIFLNAGDYVEMRTQQASGGNLDVSTISSQTAAQMSMTLVSL